MISNYVFKLLSQDTTDQTTANVIASVRTRMQIPELTEAQLPEHTYKSLKTLLGEAGNNTINEFNQPKWAVDRISDGKANRKFQKIEHPGELPLIYVTVADVLEDPEKQRLGRQQAKLEIAVFTNPEKVASSQAWNIMQRINSLFMIYGPSGIPMEKDIAENVTDIKGVLSMTVNLTGSPVSSWDVQRSIYRVDAVVIK